MNTGKSLEEQQFEACYEAILKEITEQSDAKLICMSPFIGAISQNVRKLDSGNKTDRKNRKKDCRKKYQCGLSCASRT